MSKRVSQKQAARFMREQAAREQARRRTVIVSIAAAAVLLVAGLVGWGVYASQHHGGNYSTPKSATSQADGLVLGSGPVTVDVYLDFMCPVCKAYEGQAGQTKITIRNRRQRGATVDALRGREDNLRRGRVGARQRQHEHVRAVAIRRQSARQDLPRVLAVPEAAPVRHCRARGGGRRAVYRFLEQANNTLLFWRRFDLG